MVAEVVRQLAAHDKLFQKAVHGLLQSRVFLLKLERRERDAVGADLPEVEVRGQVGKCQREVRVVALLVLTHPPFREEPPRGSRERLQGCSLARHQPVYLARALEALACHPLPEEPAPGDLGGRRARPGVRSRLHLGNPLQELG